VFAVSSVGLQPGENATVSSANTDAASASRPAVQTFDLVPRAGCSGVIALKLSLFSFSLGDRL
jgi:hypothetical protein